MFEIQKTKYGVDQMQFHLPTAVSFLCLHAPTRHDDDLSKFRPMVVAVNTDRVARKGWVVARTGPAIFGVVPMSDLAGAPSGSLDVGMDFNPILDGLKATYQLELCNIVIGGLFAVVALNFTVNSAYPMLGDADNTVTRLFGLNYLVLGAALAVIITLFRFNLVQRAFGKYVQEQLYLSIVWAGPLLVLATATALLLVAMA